MASRAVMLGHAEHERKKYALIQNRRRNRDSFKLLSLPDSEFINIFRIIKECFEMLYNDLAPVLAPSQRCTAIKADTKILAALAFYANGAHQHFVGVCHYNYMGQASLSMCLEDVTNALNSRAVIQKYVNFPSSRHKREEIMTQFMDRFNFPGVIGCIDGTHVALIRPSNHEEAYFNRKGYHSLNVLVICDANLQILHIDASYGGASHDSYIWNQSIIKSYMASLTSRGENCWLLGDSGYALKPYMMTPILGAADGTPEELYTKTHCSARNTIERCFGVLKSRWRCLITRPLHYNPIKAGKLVNACALLHNVVNAYIGDVCEVEDTIADIVHDVHDSPAPEEDIGGDAIRNVLVQRFWLGQSRSRI